MIPPPVIGLTVKYVMHIFKRKSFIQMSSSQSDFMPGVPFFFFFFLIKRGSLMYTTY